jgi:micrococcal nuclease
VKALIILWSFLCAFQGHAQLISGKVIRIADGDSFTLLTVDKKQIRIRLYGIDCPENGQDFGRVAKDFTGRILNMGKVEVIQKDIDRYDRIVGIVVVADSINLNEMLLKTGLAWHYKYFDKNPIWTAYEQAAMEKKEGLWKAPHPIAPWKWRKGIRGENSE